eukprot:1136894-Pelagomonas_calceolata.AAC.2
MIGCVACTGPSPAPAAGAWAFELQWKVWQGRKQGWRCRWWVPWHAILCEVCKGMGQHTSCDECIVCEGCDEQILTVVRDVAM